MSFAFFIAPSIVGQNFGPLPPLTAHVEVNVVNVDVTVTDHHGKPVMDLTKDDFEIFEDGKPMTVTNFSLAEKMVQKTTAVNPGSAQQEAAAPSLVHRKLLILIDNNYLQKQERDRALRTIESYLLSSEFQGQWAVAAIGHTIMPVQQFTADKSLIAGAFQTVQHMPVNASDRKSVV